MKVKCLIIILMMLLMFQLVIALELTECKGVMNPSNIPCVIISTWQFPNDCNTYSIKIFNETPALLSTRTMADYSQVTGRCNITFNYTKIGSYLMNWTNGDSSKIIMEADEGMQIAMAIVFSVFAVLFVGLGIFLYLKFKENE